MRRRYFPCALVVLAAQLCVFANSGCAQTRQPAISVASATTTHAAPYHLHLNGIGGYRRVDQFMIRGLLEGGLDAEVKAYDWTGQDAGLAALLHKTRHVEQSRDVAEMILKISRDEPGRHITITTHSAGAGIIAWALEQLPEDVKVDEVVMLAPALSPGYDLTPALRHITGHLYVFYSAYDSAVLGVGTNMFGTVDGVKTDAAGKVGFTKPASGDAAEYAKVVQFPYDSAWIQLGNIGDHIGSMSRAFARKVIAPVMLTGKLPVITRVDPLANVPPNSAPAIVAPAGSANPAAVPRSSSAALTTRPASAE